MVKVKKRKINLNEMIEDRSDRKKQKVCGDIKILFDSGSIVNAICRKIRHKDTTYVMGCSAWFSNKKIIEELSMYTEGVCVICTKDKLLKAKTSHKKYSTLPVYKESAIRYIGTGSGWNKSLMHHKFLVGMNKEGVPLWCSNGSFNLTMGASKNLENCMIISDTAVAAVFLDEFLRLYKISKPLKLN